MATGKRRAARRPGRAAALGPWLAGAVAALVLSLTVNGTWSSWTQAIIASPTNSAATTQAVILRAASSGTTCVSSADASNSSSCTTINAYGGTTSPLGPGGSQSVDLTFTNLGQADASTFTLTPGACSQSPTAGTGSPAAANLCTLGDLTVAVSCSPGASYVGGAAWTDLVIVAAAPPTTPRTHTATGVELRAGASWTCRLSVVLSASATPTAQGITVSQPLTWSLTQ